MGNGDNQSVEPPRELDSGQSQIATLEMFQSVDLSAPLVDFNQMDCFDIAQRYGAAAAEAVSNGRKADEVVFRLLAALCSCQRWLAKFEHWDKWNFCLNSAMMPWNRRDDDEAYPP
jgi:hypothetical protein